MSQLFVGNLSRNVSTDDLKHAFEAMGPCKVVVNRGFAFIDYENTGDAEKAKESMLNKDMGGQKINIEWSKKSTKYDPSSSSRPMTKRRSDKRDSDIRCFNCDRRGHFQRDCKERPRRNDRSRDRYRDDRRRRSRSRDRSPRRSSRDDSRSMDRGRNYRDNRDSSRRYGDRDNYRRNDRDDRRGGGRGGRDRRRDYSRDKDERPNYRDNRSRSRTPPSRGQDQRRDRSAEQRSHRSNNRRDRSFEEGGYSPVYNQKLSNHDKQSQGNQNGGGEQQVEQKHSQPNGEIPERSEAPVKQEASADQPPANKAENE